MVTLVGTPKVWQEFGNLFSALQHKTQNRLLSMVLSSQVQESSDKEVSGVVRAEHLASCPYAVSRQISARSIGDSSSRKVKAQRRATVRWEEPLTLAARAKAEAGLKKALHDSKDALAQAAQNHLDIRDLSSALPEAVADKSYVAEVVSLPQLNTIAPVFIDRSADFIRLKKVFEDNKLFRQKVRCIIRTTPMLPTI